MAGRRVHLPADRASRLGALRLGALCDIQANFIGRWKRYCGEV